MTLNLCSSSPRGRDQLPSTSFRLPLFNFLLSFYRSLSPLTYSSSSRTVPAADGAVPTAAFWNGAKRQHRGEHPLQLSQHAPVHDPQQPEGRGGGPWKPQDWVRNGKEQDGGGTQYCELSARPFLCGSFNHILPKSAELVTLRWLAVSSLGVA